MTIIQDMLPKTFSGRLINRSSGSHLSYIYYYIPSQNDQGCIAINDSNPQQQQQAKQANKLKLI